MPVVSQSIIRPIVPVGARTLAWLLRTPYSSPSATASSHGALGRRTSSSAGTARSSMSARRGVPVHPQHAQHVLLVVGEAGERAHPAGDAGAGGVGVPVISEVIAAAQARPAAES